MKRLWEILLILLRGIGQVFFQCNALSGLVMLIGIAFSSWQMALLALLGNIVGNATAYIAKFDCEDIRNGLYGFNGTLVGIAVGVFFRLSPVAIVYLIVASAISSLITRFFKGLKSMRGLTAPFVFATWIMLALSTVSMALPTCAPQNRLVSFDVVDALSFGFGQVMFQSVSIITGILFFVGIVVNSRVGALYAIFGAVVSMVIACGLGVDVHAVNSGLIGYNGVLCAMALGDSTRRGFVLATIAVVVSFVLQYFGLYFNVTTLTAPFVFSVWLVELVESRISKFFGNNL